MSKSLRVASHYPIPRKLKGAAILFLFRCVENRAWNAHDSEISNPLAVSETGILEHFQELFLVIIFDVRDWPLEVIGDGL